MYHELYQSKGVLIPFHKYKVAKVTGIFKLLLLCIYGKESREHQLNYEVGLK